MRNDSIIEFCEFFLKYNHEIIGLGIDSIIESSGDSSSSGIFNETCSFFNQLLTIYMNIIKCR